MILTLTVAIFYLFFRLLNIFHELFHPFCNDPQNCTWFHKKYSIFNLLLCIFSSILRNFPTYKIFRIGFDLFFVNYIFVIQLSIIFITYYLFSRAPFMYWVIYFFKYFSQKFIKLIKLFIWFINDEVHHPHYLWSIISIRRINKRNSWLAY